MNNIEQNAADLAVIKTKVDKVKTTDDVDPEVIKDLQDRLKVIETDIKAFKKYLGI